jgi:hypothetical protein
VADHHAPVNAGGKGYCMREGWRGEWEREKERAQGGRQRSVYKENE